MQPEAHAAPEGRRSYDYCDLVMKGGITSGVVYPLAIVELAKRYRFKNIGGTSAGAIAAAATAAAEYRRRQTGSSAGYDALSTLPDLLGRPGFLVSLFQPDASTRPLFNVALGLVSGGSWLRAAATIIAGLLTGYPGSALLGALIGAIVPAGLWWLASPWRVAFWWAALFTLFGALWVLVFALAATASRASVSIPRLLRDNRFGLCSGFDAGAKIGEPPLTNWFSGYLNQLAGKPADAPLTFGDLWGASQADDPLPMERAINLEMITSNLTHGRPYSLPFADNVARTFYFSPDQWRSLFPASIVDHLERTAGGVELLPHAIDGVRLVPLPAMHDLPIIVAVRMSLSFPILFNAVPLYAVDFSRKVNEHLAAGQHLTAEPCWFSDGGISSNFPLRFFDSPLPRWPTFGIDLKSPHPDHDTEAEYVWLPTRNGGGLQPAWNRFDTGSSRHRIIGFLRAIFDTTQNWHDNLEARMPGYRNRIVHISQKPDEGGLNLIMPPEVIKTLSDRGRRAGIALRDQFHWENHAWVRYRSYMSALESSVARFAASYNDPVSRQSEIWDTIRCRAGAPKPPSYPWQNASQAEFACEATGDLADAVSAPRPDDHTFTLGAPRPEPELRMIPRP